MEITWKISQLERLTETGRVNRVHYYAVIVDGENTYEMTEVQKINLTGEVTTPYADLTEAQVVGWVKAAIGAEAVTALENELADFMPITGVENGVPW